MRSFSLLALLCVFAVPAAAQDGFASPGIPCSASCQSRGPKSGQGTNGCVKEACNNPFGCQKVRYLWIGDYLREHSGASFNDQSNYFLDASDGSRAAIKAKRAEIAANLKKFKKDTRAAQAQLAALRAGGCGVSSVAAMKKAYGKYDSMLKNWGKMIAKNNGGSSGGAAIPQLVLNASNTSQTSGNPAKAAQGPAKVPVRIDREFTEGLLDVYEFCGFGGIMARNFFNNISLRELKPGEKFPKK